MRAQAKPMSASQRLLATAGVVLLLLVTGVLAAGATPPGQDAAGTPTPAPGAPLPAGSGVISGAVTNATTGEPAAGVTVELGIFDATSLVEQRTAAADAAGQYRFEGLPTAASFSFTARVEYPAGTPYGSAGVSFEEDQTAIELPISVYETTSDPSGVRVERVHFIIEFDAASPGQAQVTELMVFSLDGNRAYAGDGSGVLSFPLPAGATNLTVDDAAVGGRYQATAGGFVDWLVLPPGQSVRQVFYRYTLPYTGDRLDFKRTLVYAAANINALINDVGQQVTSPQLADQGKRDAMGASYFSLAGGNLPAGHEVTINITGLAALAKAGTADAAGGLKVNRGLLIGLMGGAAAIAAALVALGLRRRGAAAGALAAAPVADADSGALLDALAELDRAHAAGELADAAYNDQRLRLKARLRDLLSEEGQA